ncbi:hypothetical protein BH10BDE1_BH10BDE1_04960 [soil metagenome]
MERLTAKVISLLFALVSIFNFPSAAFAKTVRYELSIANKPVNITGTEVGFALMVNGGIPAPTLEFTEGDDAEITVINNVADQEVSLHWHGILLPPEEDGVAYVNTPPIFPTKSRVFKFKIRQHGTYWYHSHTMLQEQKGVYGAIVIHPKTEVVKADQEAVVVLSDWSDENADQIIRNLRKDGDFYLYKKNSVRSIFGAASAGGLKTYFGNEWGRMGGMDVSDVGYDAFLINGKRDSQLLMAHPGERIRLRIINAGSSSYFYVSLGQTPMQVIAADGHDIVPVRTKELLLGMAETYDVLFTVPEHKNYELRATSQDVTGFASAWIGMGEKVSAPEKMKPDLYAPMDHSGMNHSTMNHSTMDHSKMDHSKMNHSVGKAMAIDGPTLETLTIEDLKSPTSTVLPKAAKRYDLKLVLGGDMNRYVWHINGKTIRDDRLLMINEGDVVRYTFENSTMMHHPMHLHGHFFRVLNKNQDFSPLKHTIDVPPMSARTIEFYANEPGQWMLHCHNLFHMETGMARVVRYDTFKPTAEMAHLDHMDHHLHDPWYGKGTLQLASNAGEARYRLSQTWNEFEVRAESRRDENWNGEADLFYRRWMGNYLSLIAGGAIVDHEARAEVGLGYILPMLVRTNVLIDHKGKLRIDLDKRFQWTGTVFSDVEYRWRQDTDLGNEVAVSLMYGRTWAWSGGLKLTDHSLGAGLQYQF